MSLRERLNRRTMPQDTWWVRIDPVEVVAKAKAALERAEDDLRLAQVDGSAMVATAEQQVEQARTAVAACYEPVTVVALDPGEYEALLAEHPPRQEQAAWGPGFGRALLLAGVRGELDREEWAMFLDSQLSYGERVEGYNIALGLNVRVMDPGLPKDWTPTHS